MFLGEIQSPFVLSQVVLRLHNNTVVDVGGHEMWLEMFGQEGLINCGKMIGFDLFIIEFCMRQIPKVLMGIDSKSHEVLSVMSVENHCFPVDLQYRTNYEWVRGFSAPPARVAGPEVFQPIQPIVVFCSGSQSR